MADAEKVRTPKEIEAGVARARGALATGDEAVAAYLTGARFEGPMLSTLDCHINQAGDTYDVICSCGWKALDCDDLESAGELRRLHLGDDHYDE